MLTYRYTHKRMRGSRNGDSRISNRDILSEYGVAPTAMSVEKHMVSLMYAPHDNLTLMAKLPFYRKSMAHKNRLGQKFNTYSQGLGDAALHAHIAAYRSRWNKHTIKFTFTNNEFYQQ